MIDPVGRMIIELRDDAAVAAIVGRHPTMSTPRVGSPEPGPGWAQGPGEYMAFVVVVTLTLARHPSVPIQRPRYAIRCCGRTPEEAAALYGACSDALHHKGPRMTGAGYGVYVSHDDTGGTEEKDPDTGQPVYTFVAELVATTQPVGP